MTQTKRRSPLGADARAPDLPHAWGSYLHEYLWDHVATLTFRYAPSVDAARRELLDRWIRRVSSSARQPIACFYGLERGPSGQLHFHLLVAGTASLTIETLQTAWKVGLSKIEQYDPARGAAWYVSKGVLGRCEWYDVTSCWPPRAIDTGGDSEAPLTPHATSISPAEPPSWRPGSQRSSATTQHAGRYVTKDIVAGCEVYNMTRQMPRPLIQAGDLIGPRVRQPQSHPCRGCGKFAFPIPGSLCYWCRRREGEITLARCAHENGTLSIRPRNSESQ